MTLLLTLSRYQEEMSQLEERPERWPDRQETAQWLRTRYRITVGKSAAFNRLVELDYQRRELLVASRHTSLRPERRREIEDELVRINRDMEALKGAVKAQIGAAELRVPREQPRKVDGVAGIGLLSLAIDAFPAPSAGGQPFSSSTKVGDYTVTDHGSFATVRTPQGQVYRCAAVLFEEGASVKCDPAGGKP